MISGVSRPYQNSVGHTTGSNCPFLRLYHRLRGDQHGPGSEVPHLVATSVFKAPIQGPHPPQTLCLLLASVWAFGIPLFWWHLQPKNSIYLSHVQSSSLLAPASHLTPQLLQVPCLLLTVDSLTQRTALVTRPSHGGMPITSQFRF